MYYYVRVNSIFCDYAPLLHCTFYHILIENELKGSLLFFAMKPRGLNSYFVFNKYSFKRHTWKKEYVVWILPTIRVCRFVTGQEGGQVILWRLEGGEVEIEKILQPEIGPISAIQVQIRGTRSERWILSTCWNGK